MLKLPILKLKDNTPLNFVEKNFTNSHKTSKFAKVFRYTVLKVSAYEATLLACFEVLIQMCAYCRTASL